MFYMTILYLRILKTIFYLSECHLIIKKCPSEMHQFESVDPVYHIDRIGLPESSITSIERKLASCIFNWNSDQFFKSELQT